MCVALTAIDVVEILCRAFSREYVCYEEFNAIQTFVRRLVRLHLYLERNVCI